MNERIGTKLGIDRAEKVMEAFKKNPTYFSFIDVTAEELAEIMPTPTPPGGRNATKCDVYGFRAGSWLIIILDLSYGLKITGLNLYYPQDECFSVIV